MVLNLDSVLNDGRYFCEHLIKIEDRNRNLISFKFNPAQEILHGRLTGRDCVIKGGQMGITTYVLGLNFKETITTPGTTSVIVAHEEFLTQRLLGRINFWFENLPPIIHTDQGPMEKPKRTRRSTYEQYFAGINSVFYIGTARAHVFGRGEPIHRFQASEFAFWPDPERILIPTVNRVPVGTGSVVIESTPNGADNIFYDIVQEAFSDANSLWTLHTLPWWLEDEYRLPVGSPAAPAKDRGRIKDFNEDELAIIKQNKWDDDEADQRIRWRRYKARETGITFQQEFFESLSTCFLLTSTAYYNHEWVAKLAHSVFPAPFKGIYGTDIWEYPDDDWESPNYLIAVDPGQGKVTQSVASVWKILPEESIHVATLAGLYEPVVFAQMVKELGYFYKTAKIAPERNGHGMAFTAQVRDYPNLYYQQDVIGGLTKNVIGWATTGAARLDGRGTKAYMMDELNSILPTITCYDERIVNQIANVRIEGDGKLSMPKSGDDFHDSAAIMAATRPAAGYIRRGAAFSKGWSWLKGLR